MKVANVEAWDERTFDLRGREGFALAVRPGLE